MYFDTFTHCFTLYTINNILIFERQIFYLRPKEFADATTKVTWVIANNRCDIKGDPEWEKYAAEQEVIQAEENAEFFDEAGNKIDGNKAKLVEDLTRQEVKRFKRDIKNKIKENVELEEFEMDYCDEWNIKYLVADD